ncbi:MAG: RagB/SusD family nutrient uptake outer membrane protein [Cyclobacteriaceae bacterium]
MNAKYILTVGILLLSVVSCNDDKLNKVNPNELSVDTFYRTGAQATAAVNAIYAALQANNLYEREYFFLHDLLSDDVESGGAQLEAARDQVLNYNFTPSNPVLLAVWRGLFRVVHRSNLVIENVPNAEEDISEALKSRLLGEAYFLRAWANFDLVSMWGSVPLMSTSANTPEGRPKTPVDEIYTIILDDLDEAIERLPEQSGYGDSDRGRASKGAARALAARVHMFRNDHVLARPFLQAIIDSDEYELVDRYLDNFEEENENNEESIFEIQFTTAFGTGGAWSGDGSGNPSSVTFRGQEYGANAWRNLIPSDELVAEFETIDGGAEKDDPRNQYSFYRIGDTYNNGESVLTVDDVQGDTDKPSWRKYHNIYKRPAENTNSGINFRVIRYADVLLMMAEVENEVTGPAAALPYINQVRARADVDMPPYPTAQYPTGTVEEMRRAIIHERRVELSAEQIRNRDLKRWRRAGHITTVNEPNPNYIPNFDLLPIPTQEIDNNSALTAEDQNPGH